MLKKLLHLLFPPKPVLKPVPIGVSRKNRRW